MCGRQKRKAASILLLAPSRSYCRKLDEIEEVQIAPNDIRVDTFRASGAGGQHVQKTDSAIRITHIPSGVVVECQDERSQHKNRARAMSLLKAKLLAEERNKQQNQQAATRRNLVGTGDRSERIRTYNYSQGRLTDHRINLSLYQLQTDIIEGDLRPVINALIHEHQADLVRWFRRWVIDMAVIDFYHSLVASSHRLINLH